MIREHNIRVSGKFSGIVMLCVDFVNAIVCVIYLALIWLVSDFAFWIMEKFFNITFAHYYAGWLAIAASVIVLIIPYEFI